MRILAISAFFPPDAVGGYEVTARDTLTHLARRGHDIAVLTAAPEKPLDECNAAAFPIERTLRRLPYSIPAGNRFLDRLNASCIHAHNYRVTREAIGRHAPDCIYLWSGALLTAGVPAACEASNMPLACHLGDTWFLEAAGRRGRGIGGMAMRLLRRLLGSREAVLDPRRWRHIYVSHFLRNHYRTCGIEAAASEVIYNGSEFASPPPAWSATPPALFRLCFAGRLHPSKGVEMLLNAFAHMQDMPLHLDIFGAGQPDYERHLRAQASTMGLQERISWHGRVSHAALCDGYARSHLFCMPSLWEEPFGLVVIEAMAQGLPVVATRRGGLPELVAPGTGLLADAEPTTFAAAMRALLSDWPALRHASETAQRHARTNYQWPDKIDAIESFLREMVHDARTV